MVTYLCYQETWSLFQSSRRFILLAGQTLTTLPQEVLEMIGNHLHGNDKVCC